MMSHMHMSRMVGGGVMSPWTRVPGETWFAATMSFAGMWLIMMAAMMLPSLVPALGRYRDAVRGAACSAMRERVPRVTEPRLAALTALVGAGYFAVWGMIGIAIFPLGAAVTAFDAREGWAGWVGRSLVGMVILAGGVMQLTKWKACHLACCRDVPGRCTAVRVDVSSALEYGVQLGLHCCACSAGLTMILLAIGVMDWRAMAAITVATTVERVAPAGERVARVIGYVAVVAGMALVIGAR